MSLLMGWKVTPSYLRKLENSFHISSGVSILFMPQDYEIMMTAVECSITEKATSIVRNLFRLAARF